MPKTPAPRTRTIREPVQVYLAADDSALLHRLTVETGLSKAEVLRRGVRSFARDQGTTSPMLQFVDTGDGQGWPRAAAVNHDALLAESYGSPRRKHR
ncbi:MAG: hypothetical protein AAB224_00545 [Gemmatimonadota bacterium]